MSKEVGPVRQLRRILGAIIEVTTTGYTRVLAPSLCIVNRRLAAEEILSRLEARVCGGSDNCPVVIRHNMQPPDQAGT